VTHIQELVKDPITLSHMKSIFLNDVGFYIFLLYFFPTIKNEFQSAGF
jgi:hypothetical protein